MPDTLDGRLKVALEEAKAGIRAEFNAVLRKMGEDYQERRKALEAAHEHAARLIIEGYQQKIRALEDENATLRAKVRTITDHYKPGWVDGLKAVAHSAGFDPDNARHDGVDPPSFIQDVIDMLRRDVRDLKDKNERLRALLDEAEGIVRDYSPGNTVWLDAVARERRDREDE